MSSDIGKQFIAGQRIAAGSNSLKSVAAADGSVSEQSFIEATSEEVRDAVAVATEAFGAYRATSPADRAKFLETIADEIDALGDDVIADVMRETGLPEARLTGERTRTSNQMRLFATVLRRGDYLGARIDADAGKPDIRQYKIGLGPVAVFGASNFPFAFSVAGGDTASALAAGCPVVVKAHPGHLMTSEHVAAALTRAVEACDMPAGTFNMIYGDKVGAQLVQEPDIKAVGFTGSPSGGRALFDLATSRPEPIPVFAEMSSINPMLMLPDALAARAETIGTELADSVALGCGQFCTGPGLILGIRSSEFTRCIDALGKALADKSGQTMLNAKVYDNYVSSADHLANMDGVEEVASGQAEQGQGATRLFRADKALLLDGDGTIQREVFGPCTVVIEVDSPEELRAAAAAIEGQLTMTLTAEASDLETFDDLLPMLEERAGRILFNGFPTGVAVCDAMVHGGPYPATSDSRSTSVGTLAIERYLRPVCYQNYPDAALPAALKYANPLGLRRLVNGEWSDKAL